MMLTNMVLQYHADPTSGASWVPDDDHSVYPISLGTRGLQVIIKTTTTLLLLLLGCGRAPRSGPTGAAGHPGLGYLNMHS